MKDLKFKKLVFKGDSGVTCQYSYKGKKGVPRNCTETIVADLFDETKTAILNLREFLFVACGFNTIDEVRTAEAFVNKMGEKELPTLINKATKKLMQRITMRGVTLSYDSDGKVNGCVLTAMVQNSKGDAFVSNTPFIHLDRVGYYGFEDRLTNALNELIALAGNFIKGDYNVLETAEEDEVTTVEDDANEADEEQEKDPFDDKPSKLKIVSKDIKKKTARKKAA